MKKIVLALSLASSIFALEFRIGSGSYDVDLKIMEFMNHDVSYDTTVFYVTQPRSDINDKLFYYYDIEYHTSDSKNQRTEFANVAANYQWPIVGSINDNLNRAIEMMPVYSEGETFGGDFNFGIGYDLVNKNGNYFAIAINSGMTLPNMSSKNLTDKAKFAYKMIDKWDMDLYTYKIGPSLRAKYNVNSAFSLSSTFGFGFQKAYVSSDLFKSDVNSKGGYSNFDLSLKVTPSELNVANFPKNISITLGHTYKKWSVDSVDVNLFNFFQFDVMRPFDLDLESSYTYIGLEYIF